MKLTLVSGNQGKLREWQRILPATMELAIHDLDLDEIQSLDLEAIVADKAKRAYDILKTPVLVEDISAGLESLNWLPGPFIKFFEHRLGQDALYKLAGKAGQTAKVTCMIAYYDGKKLISAKVEVMGQVVESRGQNGFGFDKVFIPDGSTKTYGQMTHLEKDKVSHRAKAIALMVQKLNEL